MPCTDWVPDSHLYDEGQRSVREEQDRERLALLQSLVEYVHSSLGWGDMSAKGKNRTYCAQWLCQACGEMPVDDQERIIYNARNPMARKLADWWEEHQKQDAARKAREEAEVEARRKERERELARRKALRKVQNALTPEERQLLGLP